MPRTALGHARYKCHNEIVYHRLDFEGRTGTFKIRVARGQNRISASPRGLSVTETRYQHGFTSPSPWWRPTDATRRRWSAACRDRLPAAGGHARRGGRASRGGRRRRCARRAGGGAPGWQRDAVSTRSDGRRRRAKAPEVAVATSGGGDGMRDGGDECGAAAGDGEVVGAFQPREDSA